VPWWAWTLIVVAIVTVAIAIAFRKQLRFAMTVAKAMAKDERLPRSLRWAIGIALAIKVMPVPDFGIDEVILVVCGVLLLTVHLSTCRSIIAEIRAAEAAREVDAPRT
jgi:hypothetical protein